MSRGLKRAAFFLALASVSFYAQGAFAAQVTTFVSPDSSFDGFSSFIDSVDSSLYLSVYEIDSPFVYEKILKLLQEGKDVTVIVDDSPAGGLSRDEKSILSALSIKGARVYATGDQYRFYHGKYAVSDNDTLFLTTENLGRNGFPEPGSIGNRGWGVIIEDRDISNYFAKVFFNDLEDSSSFEAIEGVEINYSVSTVPYKPVFSLRRYEGDFKAVTLIAPEDAIEKIVWLLKSANTTINVEQFYIYKYWGERKTGSVEKTPNQFLEAAIKAARRGVKVRILLDSTWYNIESGDPVSNYNTVLYVNEIARREGLDMEARLADLERLGIEKLHTKGVVVDRRASCRERV